MTLPPPPHPYLQGVDAVAVHGDKDQSDRESAIDAFKRGLKDVLVATDVASKGLDFPDIQHVVNYDMPDEVLCVGGGWFWGYILGFMIPPWLSPLPSNAPFPTRGGADRELRPSHRAHGPLRQDGCGDDLHQHALHQ